MTDTLAKPPLGSEYLAYRQVLAEQATRSPEDWTFKANPAYRAILEHVSPAQGEGYIDVLAEHPRWSQIRRIVAETALLNDSFGMPVKADFDRLGVTCSPTNLRYAVQAVAIRDHAESLGLDRVNFVELGGGYGGLALFMARLAPWLVASYTIIDVSEATDIQKAFAAAVGVPVRHSLVESDSYLISAYGFSEFSPEMRTFYQETLLPNCRHGYLVWNMIPVYPFTGYPLEVFDERPLTGPGNKVVRF